MATGSLTKLKLTAYEDAAFETKLSDGEFTSLVNPEKYKSKVKIEYNEEQGQGTSAHNAKFTKILPQDLDLVFLFDRTGIIDGQNSDDQNDGIIDDLEAFKRIVIEYNGDKHRPNFVKIGWGSLLFKGSLLEMDVEFKLFAPDGTPLRATVSTKFKGAVENDLRVAKENNSSPDLTHVRIVKAGDTLPLMTYKIYGDSKYYLEVAKANKITNFRSLEPGQKIFFPPIEKQA